MDQHKNFASSLVAIAPSPAGSGTSLVVTTGEGTLFPAVPFNAVIYPVSLRPTAGNAEIVRVTAIAVDTFTITRTQEGTSARTVLVGDNIVASISVKTLTDVENGFSVQRFRGLHLRTHPDSDLVAARVWMTAEEVVMDDGTRLAFTTPVTANIAAAGAGGLDTGAELASTWYEIYAIAKGDGTKNLLLHRAKDYFEDETSTAGEDGQHLLRDAVARTRLGQGFKVDTAGKLEFVDIKIAKIGAPTGEIYVTIQNDTAGVPGTTIHATSDKLNVASLSTTSTLIRFVFRTPFTTVAATQYHLVLNGTFAVSAVNHVLWRADTTAAAYANGSKAEANNGTWTADADDDFIFKVFVTRNDTAVTMPTDYTKKAKVGYVFNTSASNFRPFVQYDQTVSPLAVAVPSGTFTVTVATLVDWSAGGLPPTSCIVRFLVGHSVVDTAVMSAGVFDGYGATGNASDQRLSGQSIVWPTIAGSANPISLSAPILTEYQATYHLVGSGTGQVWISDFVWNG